MYFNSKSLAVLLAASTYLLGASASPLVKRDDTTTTESSATSTSTSSSSSSTSTAPTAALLVTTISGVATTIEVAYPTTTASSAAASGAPTTDGSAASTTTTAPATSTTKPAASGDFPVCHDANAKPFCLPNNNQSVYVGETYYVTWDPDFYGGENTTINVIINYANDSTTQAWSSGPILNSLGVTTVTMDKAWLQGYSLYNLTLKAMFHETATDVYQGPEVMLTNKPPNHYPAPPKSKPNKEGLMIGLPVSLGFVALVVVGLFLGMRKHRHIGLGNIMGRKKGYGARQSRRQRLGLGSKKGAIRLEQRDLGAEPEYRDDLPPPRTPGHTRDESLGSLVETPRQNAFRSEIERQQTGGRMGQF